jgi:hypothetical protein
MRVSLRQLNFWNPKINNIFKLFAFCTVIVVSSCQNDNEVQNSNEQKPIFGKVNLNQIPEIKKAIDDKKNKITSRQNASFYLNLINPENIITIIDILGRKSYTFSLNLEEENQLTNLVVQEKENGLQYYLVKYTATDFSQWKSELQNKIVSTIKPTVIYELLEAPSRTTSKLVCNEGNIRDQEQNLGEMILKSDIC